MTDLLELARPVLALPPDVQLDYLSRARIAAGGRIKKSFAVPRFKDGDDIGKPKWLKHVMFGGYGEQGWVAFDQRFGGASVGNGAWGERIHLLYDGRLTGDGNRQWLEALETVLRARSQHNERDGAE